MKGSFLRLMLDTNAYSAIGRGHPHVVDLVRRAATLLLPAVVVGELLGGFRRGSRYEENLADLRRFLDGPRAQLATVTWTTADRYARIYTTLRANGTPIPTNDMWIAAQALEAGADLLSFDPHFGHVDGLAWTQPARVSR